MREFQLEAVFAMSTRCRGAPCVGYPTIVGSGPNAAIMHYEAVDGLVAPGHLVLVDAGAEWRWARVGAWLDGGPRVSGVQRQEGIGCS